MNKRGTVPTEVFVRDTIKPVDGMPIVVITADQKKARERWEAVTAASNAVMRQALWCNKAGAYCFKCVTLCEPMKQWECVADSGDNKK